MCVCLCVCVRVRMCMYVHMCNLLSQTVRLAQQACAVGEFVHKGSRIVWLFVSFSECGCTAVLGCGVLILCRLQGCLIC